MARDAVDVVIVGAGVAGLAAARALLEANIDILVLEARDRIGGRIFTHHDPALAVPVELGAEFIHGSAPELSTLAMTARLLACDVEGARLRSTRGKLQPIGNFWQQLDEVMRRLNAKRKPDRSFQEFLETRPGGARLARQRALALQWVEGFHAADPRRASERALAEGGSPGDDEGERRIARFLDGFDAVPQWLANDLDDHIRFSAVVSRICWRAKEVELDVRQADSPSTTTVTARTAIITVPLGVLQAPPDALGAIVFDPPLTADPTKEEALAGMAMGAVVRVAFRLRERFWTTEPFMRRSRRRDLDRLAFLHTPDPHFPVWWTPYPARAPLLIAWSGGPRAQTMSTIEPSRVVDMAVAALGAQFGMRSRETRRMVEAAYTHDWQNDPFARGAYSYMLVGSDDAPGKLSRPLRGTLFFAGEAADVEGRTGTVHGAIATGQRAARQVRRAL